jgi:hypothetical protein
VSVVATALLLGLLVALMLRYRIARPGVAAVCVLFGLVLGAIPIGGEVEAALTSVGEWLAAQVEAL